METSPPCYDHLEGAQGQRYPEPFETCSYNEELRNRCKSYSSVVIAMVTPATLYFTGFEEHCRHQVADSIENYKCLNMFMQMYGAPIRVLRSA